MKKLCLVILIIIQNLAYADFMPFNHDIQCISNNDFSRVKIVYNKSEYTGTHWQGGIHWEIFTGFNEQLSNVLKANKVVRNGLTDGSNKLITRAAAAGTLTDWIEQDSKEPIMMLSSLNNEYFKLIENGKAVGKFLTLIQDLRISKIKETGYNRADHRLVEKEYYLMELKGTGASALVKYKLSECRLLN